MKLNIDESAYKIGLDEIGFLKEVMTEVLQPVLDDIQEHIYWDKLAFEPSEYRSRDGFIPYASNYGGMELVVIIPKCEESSFQFLQFGECEDCQGLSDRNELNRHGDIALCGYDGQECASENDGHLDAKLSVWLKFEGLDAGVMGFYLVLSGGNGDAPYFREHAAKTVFETEFKAKTIAEFKRNANKHIKKLLKAMA